MLRKFEALLIRDETGCKVVARGNRERNQASGMVMGKMSKCSFKSSCGELVVVVHGDDILLAGPRSLVDAARNSLRKRFETGEQMMGAGSTDASDIVMLNRRVQWTEEGIRVSPDPRQRSWVWTEPNLPTRQ